MLAQTRAHPPARPHGGSRAAARGLAAQVENACFRSLESLEDRLFNSDVKADAKHSAVRSHATRAPHRARSHARRARTHAQADGEKGEAHLGANLANERLSPRLENFKYTVTASKRAEHRRLYTFIRLTEYGTRTRTYKGARAHVGALPTHRYIIYDELHNLVLNSTMLILRFVTPQPKLPTVHAHTHACAHPPTQNHARARTQASTFAPPHTRLNAHARTLTRTLTRTHARPRTHAHARTPTHAGWG